MKKKLLVLLIAVIPTLMPNFASAIAIGLPDSCWGICLSYCCHAPADKSGAVWLL